MCESHSVMSNCLQLHGLYSPWNSPGQNTGVGSLSLLQMILSTQTSNPGLPHCRQILYQLSHKGSPTHPPWYSNWHLVITQDPWSRKWQPIPVFLPGKIPRTEATVHGVAKSQTQLTTEHHLSRYAGLYY